MTNTERFTMRLIHFSLLLCCFGALVCLSGCQGKPPNPDGRLDVSGTITLNGGSFEGAEMYTIAFIPIDEPSLGSSTTTINPQTGKYLLTMHDGLKPGRYRVSIMASAYYDKRTNRPVTPQTGELDEYLVQLLPAKFNADSEIEFEVLAGRKNVFDYDVAADIQP